MNRPSCLHPIAWVPFAGRLYSNPAMVSTPAVVPHPPLVVLGYSQAAMYLNRSPPVGAVLSIQGRREFGVELAGVPRLDLHFDDVDVVPPGDVLTTYFAERRRRWNELNGLVQVPPSSADAAAIIDFAERTRELKGNVLCHCGGGVSRAPAAAVICLTVWTGEGHEVVCASEVLRLRPMAVPHAGLVRFADGLLGREGKLVRAVTALQR